MKRITKKICLMLLMASAILQALAQPGRPAPAPSPVVNPDNTVTFNYQNKNAKKVQVDVQFAGRHDMVKGENDVWTVTLGPTTPDI